MLSHGPWKSIEELEDNVTLQELHRLYLARHRAEYNDKIFLAALQGVEMPPYNDPDYEDVPSFEDIKKRAEQRKQELLGGKTATQAELEELGIMVEEY